jgi:hypothetical protein
VAARAILFKGGTGFSPSTIRLETLKVKRGVLHPSELHPNLMLTTGRAGRGIS